MPGHETGKYEPFDRDTIEPIGLGYWETPGSIDPRTYNGTTPEQDAQIREYILGLFCAELESQGIDSTRFRD